MNTSLLELHTTRYWNILPSTVPGFIKTIKENMATHRLFEHRGMPGSFLSRSHSFEPFAATYVTSSPKRDIESTYDGYIKDDDEFIDLIPVNGGITRDGACGYGSRAHRDQMLYSAKKKNCIGHIFLINTPGGSAYSKDDYQEAIDAARSAGQPVIACIDGLCASAGYALACMCDAIYYTCPSNIVGCIGTMAIYVTNKDGDQNSVTQEIYHEDYDPESYDKNIEIRKASEGDNSLIVEELKEHGRTFRELVMRNRPNVKDEQLHGRTFKASEVEGTLVDARHSLQECIDMLANHAFIPQSSTTQINQPSMDPNMQTALIEAQASVADLTSQVETLNSTIAERDASITELNSQVETLNASVAERDSQIAELNAQAESLNSTIAERDASIAELNSQIETLNATLAERDTTLAERDSQIADLNAQAETLNASLAERDATIAELSAQAPADTNPAPATAQAKEGDGDKQTPTSACASKEGMTLDERRAAQKERDRQLGI